MQILHAVQGQYSKDFMHFNGSPSELRTPTVRSRDIWKQWAPMASASVLHGERQISALC